MTSPSHDRLFTRDELVTLMWRFGKRVALSGFWSDNFAQQIEPHYRKWAEEEITKFLREKKHDRT